MDVAELERQVEYKFAPPPLLAVQALANTFSFEPEEERLADPEHARRWLVQSDLATRDVRVTEAEWRKLVDFRAAMRDLIDANLDGDAEVAAAAMRPFAAEHPVAVAVGDGGAITLDLDPVGSVDELISQLLGIVLQARTEDQWPRLKICASDECRWAFYDGSRNRGGTWCKMETCGNVIKNRAYRRRLSASHS
jgi:predicted RNA-binding Zn ribbon-like protein